jgi:hypothetical protein
MPIIQDSNEERDDDMMFIYSGDMFPNDLSSYTLGTLLGLLHTARKLQSPFQVSELKPSRERWLETKKSVHELRERRMLYFEFDCRVPTCDIKILCVSDIPRSDEEFKRLIEEGVVHAGLYYHALEIECTDGAEELIDSLSPQQRDDLVVIFSIWDQQGDLHREEWCECAMITVELVEAIKDITKTHSASTICAAIKEYARILFSDMNSRLPAWDLISFLTFKDKKGSWMCPSFHPDYWGQEDF